MYGHCIWHRRLLRYQSAICVYARAVASFIALALTAPSRLLQQLVNLLLRAAISESPAAAFRLFVAIRASRGTGRSASMKSHLKSIWTAFGFEPPREHGHQTVESIAAMQNGIAQVFIAMGGNFVRAVPRH